jgi:uncharacterized protein with FMN-binding domain
VGIVLLLALKPHGDGSLAAVPEPSSATGGTAAGTPGTSGGGTAASGQAPSGTGRGGSHPAATRTVDGDTVQTVYGPVQLRVTLKGGHIAAVKALRLPDGNPRDQQIDDFAVPQLTQEVIAADSASVHAVSGATYTSEGYLTSLQSALDRAGG